MRFPLAKSITTSVLAATMIFTVGCGKDEKEEKSSKKPVSVQAVANKQGLAAYPKMQQFFQLESEIYAKHSGNMTNYTEAWMQAYQSKNLDMTRSMMEYLMEVDRMQPAARQVEFDRFINAVIPAVDVYLDHQIAMLQTIKEGDLKEYQAYTKGMAFVVLQNVKVIAQEMSKLMNDASITQGVDMGIQQLEAVYGKEPLVKNDRASATMAAMNKMFKTGAEKEIPKILDQWFKKAMDLGSGKISIPNLHEATRKTFVDLTVATVDVMGEIITLENVEQVKKRTAAIYSAFNSVKMSTMMQMGAIAQTMQDPKVQQSVEKYGQEYALGWQKSVANLAKHQNEVMKLVPKFTQLMQLSSEKAYGNKDFSKELENALLSGN